MSSLAEGPLEVCLEAVKQYLKRFTLPSASSQSALTLKAESDVVFHELYQRLLPVLMGHAHPAGALPPLELLPHGGTWKALLPDAAPLQQREALAQAMRTGRFPLLLCLPQTLTWL
ncbi:hypothetical protein EPA93_11350 [Ktedonosporobacter rubrisoli]|uniref:Uncharacterized protein n=1 Tax=Ktedonosporobacter rubrisoli TaxID=2509675 RepID=A0A4P6JMU3_KTERU|nr:hypothetical protein [Ktedonosporobacter rubrisoli]QBD76564.1 hypothetical protein EPA93_11350 [Ktedonosporobacter rubrisoli]